ncbi:MAG: DUF1361 domain-containing protein [bacterium]
MSKYKVTLPKQIRIFVILVIVLVFGFTVWYDSSYFIYLIWNVFLAFLPYLLSANLLKYSNKEKINKIVLIFGLVFWLLLFPNAPYLASDIIHLGINPLVPAWLDIFLLFSCAWIGMYLGIYSLFHIEKILLSFWNKNKTNIAMVLIILLSSFGIYLGRFLRWNSWDIFFQPKLILNDIANIFYKPVSHLDAYITTIIFFIFITASYYSWKYVNKMTHERV